MQAQTNFVLCCIVLASIFGVPKACALERVLQSQAFITHNFQSYGHHSQVCTFIIDIISEHIYS